MALLALHGPMYSGKSTLGHELERLHDYTFVDYTGYLKHLAARSLQASGSYHSVEMILANKANYRVYLQELGRLINFDSGNPFIEEVLGDACFEPWLNGQPTENVVFDNVRTPEQWAILKSLGFTLVRLHITNGTQIARAEASGATFEQLVAMKKHPCEAPLPYQPGEIGVWSWDNEPVSELADLVHGLATGTVKTA